jgi:hypothetical protein
MHQPHLHPVSQSRTPNKLYWNLSNLLTQSAPCSSHPRTWIEDTYSLGPFGQTIQSGPVIWLPRTTSSNPINQHESLSTTGIPGTRGQLIIF